MLRLLISSAIAVLVFTVLLGLAYPLTLTGVSQVAFPGKANGDPSLIAEAPPRGDGWFVPRPSQTDYSTTATAFSNRGPNQRAALAFYRRQIVRYLKREGPYNPRLTVADIPIDAVTTSGSGLDPLISAENAAIQARRVAAARGLPLARVRQLVDEHTTGRFLRLVGEPGVNVTELNRALAKEAS
jgi:K+-transporting ATPase ATPase C chain